MTKRMVMIGAAAGIALLVGAEAVVCGIARGHRLIYAAAAGKVDVVRAAIEREPHDAGLWQLLGQAYDSRLDYDAAVAAYRKSLDLNPLDEETWWMMGVAQVCRRDSEGIQAAEAGLRSLDKQAATEFARVAPLGCCAFGGCRTDADARQN